jgi:plasmid stabilization system protein ParE
MGLIFHRLIKRDLRTVMTHYEEEVGPNLAGRFQREFEQLALRIEENPRRFHFASGVLRRANFPSFPYHLLYRETEGGHEDSGAASPSQKTKLRDPASMSRRPNKNHWSEL